MPSDKPAEASPAAKSSGASAARPAPSQVLYADWSGKKKKKRRYSRGLKQVQKLERGTTKASRRMADALESGLRRYRKLSDKSARKKRDGAIRDALDNVSRGIGRTMRIASDVPYDFAKRVNTRRFSSTLRNTIRIMVPPIFRF